MAIELGKVNVTDLTENDYKVIGLGINTSSDSSGVFPVNFTTLTQAKSNLINLILTKKGERVGQPEFGCDIWKVLFEPMIDSVIESRVEDSIIEAVNSWMPYIEVNEIIIDTDSEKKDNNQLGVEINFYLKSNPKLNESITINVKA